MIFFYFQSVLQQASSLMSQGDDSLLSTIQVRQYQRQREETISISMCKKTFY